ncbi:cupin-like domain-containing protein [Cystobacter fuscus]
MSSRPIDVRTRLSPEEFKRTYIVGNRPVIVTDAMDNWKARAWTPEGLRRVFADAPIGVSDDGPYAIATLSYDDFLRHLREAETSDGPPDGSIAHLRYLRAREQYAFDRIRGEWSKPYFMPEGGYCVPLAPFRQDPSQVRFPGFNLYVSPRGAASKLHIDGLRTNSVLCQIHGVKRCFVIPPDQAHLVPSRAERQARKGRHLSRHPEPDFGKATAMQFDLHPGEIMLFPHGWFHEVHTLSTSISLSWNFVLTDEARQFIPWYMNALVMDRQKLNVG